MKTLMKPVAFGLALAAMSGAAHAATATGTLNVSANVTATCTVSATTLQFNNYSGAQLDAATIVSPNCTNGTPYSIGLDAGAGAGATVTSRKLTGASGTLNYSLYTTAARTTVWGNTPGTDTVAGTGNGNSQNVNVFGRIPAGQAIITGSLTDQVTVTVNY